MSATPTGVMAKAVLLVLCATEQEAEQVLDRIAARAVPETPERVLAELRDELTALREGR